MAYSVVLLLGGALAGLCGLAIYRLFFDPLAKFPGPKVAAISFLYEYYYEIIKGGQYIFEIQRMHEKYGPIVRISPCELHVNEPNFASEIYTGSSRPLDKYDYMHNGFGLPDGIVSTIPQDLHRKRRAALQPFFSKQSVAKLEPLIYDAVDKLCSQLEKAAGSDRVVSLGDAYSCFTADVVTAYAFAKSTNFLDSPTFQPNLHKAISTGSTISVTARYFPIVLKLMHALPDAVAVSLMPEGAMYVQWQRSLQKQLDDIKHEVSQGGEKKPAAQSGQRTIFHELLQGNLSEAEKRSERIWQEGQVVVGAGTETTAWTLVVTTFYLLASPPVLARLRAELATVFPADLAGAGAGAGVGAATARTPTAVLEQLPYLSAVVIEGLRLSHGLSTRLQRVDPHAVIKFRARVPVADGDGDPSKTQEIAYDIPPGVPVSMTAPLVHLNPTLFPDPLHFDPDRWLDADGKRDRSKEKYMLAFCKGTRQCLGINLAYAELYLCLASLMHRLGDRLQLFETDKSDVEFVRDIFVPEPKASSKGVRVKVLPLERDVEMEKPGLAA